MRIGIIGSLSALAAKVKSRFTRLESKPWNETVTPTGPVRQAPAPHMIRFRTTTGRPVFGPSFDVPREMHHISRETCRHYLSARFFASVSAGNPLMSRRERRRMARLFACLEYRRMMQDKTNVVDPELEALTSRMSALQLCEAAA